MIKKIIILSFTLFVIATMLPSCGTEITKNYGGDGLTIDKMKNYEYVIVYGANASDTVVQQASLLCSDLKEKYSVTAHIQSDWDYRPNDSLENHGADGVVEILVGETNREPSINVYNNLVDGNQYIVEIKNNSLIFAATSEKILIEAIDEFKATYLNGEKSKVTLPDGILLQNSDYSFFNIAQNGRSDCTIVIPDDISPRIRNLATSISTKVNALCSTNVKVIQEGSVDSTENCILIGNLRDPDSQSVISTLKNGESTITCKNSKLIIAGYDEAALLNGIFSFMGNIVMKHDRNSKGEPYLYFPTDLEISDFCNLSVPNVPGGVIAESSQLSSGLFSVTYSDVDSAEFGNYIELLKSAGFIVMYDKIDNSSKIYSLRAIYTYMDNSISVEIALNFNYDLAASTLKMSIACTTDLSQ